MKRLYVLVFCLLIATSFAEIKGDAKKKSDPLYMDLPDNLHHGFPQVVTLYINDKFVQEEADAIEISMASSPYGPGVVHTDDGAFRETIKYNGEKTVSFGIRSSTMPGQMTSISVGFYKTKVVDTMPDTFNDPAFSGYNCNNENIDIFCGEGECLVCAKAVAALVREYGVSWSRHSIQLPDRYEFVDGKKSKDGRENFASGASYSYSGEKTYTNSQGHEFKTADIYSMTLDISDYPWGIDARKESVESFFKKGKVENAGAPGGMTSGRAIEAIEQAPFTHKEYDDVNLRYMLISELDPPGSGLMELTVNRRIQMTKGSGDGELEKVIAEAKKMASSFQIHKDDVYTPDRALRHEYHIYKDEEEEEEPGVLSIYGRITDTFGQPLPYVTVVAVVKKNEYTGYSDKDGKYTIPLAGLELKESEDDVPIDFYVDLSYVRDGKNYFAIKGLDPRDNNWKTISFLTKEHSIKDFSDTKIDAKIDGNFNAAKVGTTVTFAKMQQMSVIYFHSAQAIEYFLEVLKADIDYKLPVDVWVGSDDGRTLYSPDGSDILISAQDAPFTSKNRPKNREYHEFAHHLMFAVYGDWPEGRMKPGVKNHDGMWNANTGDSYLEGFAEFMALAISDHFGDKKPDIYASFGSMEEDYKPWDGRGYYEELAVASLLWDMYDSDNEGGDRLTLTIDEMWAVLKEKHADYSGYYEAFVKTYPDKKREIDLVFQKHGFFADTRVGNNDFDAGEPWKWKDQAKTNKTFIDLSDNATLIKWADGLATGKAASYQRPNRSQAVMLKGAFISVPEDEVDFYTVTVTHEGGFTYDYETQRAEGKIYVSPLPIGSKATISVKPYSTAYVAQKPLEIDAAEYYSMIDESKDFAMEHDFDLKATGEEEEHAAVLFAGVKPSYQYRGDLGEKVELESEDDERDLKAGEPSGSSWFGSLLPFLLIGAVVAGFGYGYVKVPAFRKGLNTAAKKAGEAAKKGLHAFMTKGIPAIKKGAKAAAHGAKVAYQKARPHVIKAGRSTAAFVKQTVKRIRK